MNIPQFKTTVEILDWLEKNYNVYSRALLEESFDLALIKLELKMMDTGLLAKLYVSGITPMRERREEVFHFLCTNSPTMDSLQILLWIFDTYSTHPGESYKILIRLGMDEGEMLTHPKEAIRSIGLYEQRSRYQ